MAVLTTKQRKKLPKKDFALSGDRYPINDRAHAANAKARASQEFMKGMLSQSEKEHIDAMANKMLGKPKPKKGR